MNRFVRCLVPLAALAATPLAFGADAGDPIFPKDLNDKARAEVVYNNIKRDLDTGDQLKADAYFARLHTDVGQTFYLDFDLGAMDPSGGKADFYWGIGLRALAYDGEKLRVSPWVQAHFAHDLDTRWGSTDYIDGDAGLTFAVKLPVGNDLTILPYAGPIVSILRIDGERDYNEDQTVGGLAGVSLLMPGNNSFRVEGQFYDHVNVSIAAGIAF